MKKVLSIIIPVYNGEKYIKNLLEFAKNSNKNESTEFIFVDDGSKDSTYSILKSYLNEYILVFHKENGGVSSARNFGIEKAQGEYITFIDSDDDIAEDYLEKIYSFIKEEPELICFDIDLIYPSKQIFNSLRLKTEKLSVSKSEVFDRIISGEWVRKFSNSPCNKVYKRKILVENKIFFDENKTIGEDLLFNLEYYLNINEITCYEENLYKYVIRENSIMTTYKDTLVDELFKYTDILKRIAHKYLISLDDYKIKMFYIFRLYPIIIGETEAPTKKEGLENLKKYLNHEEMKYKIPISYIIKMNYIQLISYLVFTLHLSNIVFNIFRIKNKK